jgi:hypothetical protein
MAYCPSGRRELRRWAGIANLCPWRLLMFLVAIPLLSSMPACPALAQQADASQVIITPARISEIRGRAMLSPSQFDFTGVDQYFGITDGVSHQVRQAGFRTRSDQAEHHFAFRIDGSSPSFIIRASALSNHGADASVPAEFWVCDSDGNLLAAAVLTNGAWEMRPIESARSSFNDEMRLWASINNFAPPAPVPSGP